MSLIHQSFHLLFICQSFHHHIFHSFICLYINSFIHPSSQPASWPTSQPASHISNHPFSCPSIYLAAYLSIYQAIHQSIHLSSHQSLHSAIYLSISPSISPSINPSSCLSIQSSINLPVHQSICPCVIIFLYYIHKSQTHEYILYEAHVFNFRLKKFNLKTLEDVSRVSETAIKKMGCDKSVSDLCKSVRSVVEELKQQGDVHKLISDESLRDCLQLKNMFLITYDSRYFCKSL